MSVFNLAKFGLRFGKRGVKKILEIHKKSQQNRYIEKNFGKGSETDKANMTNKFLKNKTDLKKLVKLIYIKNKFLRRSTMHICRLGNYKFIYIFIHYV